MFLRQRGSRLLHSFNNLTIVRYMLSYPITSSQPSLLQPICALKPIIYLFSKINVPLTQVPIS